MAVKKRSKVSAEFNMSSLTDIIFLLLIFFMLTSSIVTPNALNLQLPGKKTSPPPPKAKNKIVSIDAETSSPQIIVNGLENDLKIEPQVEPQHNPSPIGLDEASFVHLSESDTEYKAIPVMSPTGLSDAEEEEIPSHAIERDSTIDR